MQVYQTLLLLCVRGSGSKTRVIQHYSSFGTRPSSSSSTCEGLVPRLEAYLIQQFWNQTLLLLCVRTSGSETNLSLIIVLQPIKDWVLYLVVAILVGVDVIVLSIVTVWRTTLQSRLLQRTVCTTTNLNCLSLFRN